MTITAIRLDQFTAFRKLALEASQCIPVVIGAHGLGKTHLCGVCISMALRSDV
jgi:predicted ATPase